MNPERYFLPNIPNMGIRINSMPMMNIQPLSPKRLGLIGKASNGFKNFNWTNILNGANKTLNVMNQTIPLIRQTRPMINNMKSMFKLAKAFGNETISKKRNTQTNYHNINKEINKPKYNEIIENYKNNNFNHKESNYPIFFI